MVNILNFIQGSFMKSFKIHRVIMFLLVITSVNIDAQINILENSNATTTASSLAYPQSVFVDSQNGHVWVSDFDNNRVLRYDVTELTSVEKNNEALFPAHFSLNQNYPNPFNPATQINFVTKSTQFVSLTVYDLLGQTVAVLFRGVVNANTTHSIIFDASSLPGGIYLYTLQTAYGSEVKKMCLSK